jgi:hypothetical protein
VLGAAHATPVDPTANPAPFRFVRAVSVAAIVILTVKCVVFATDPTPLFFLGDSENYVRAALIDLTDTDRPYLYGVLVRCLAVWTGSLTALVFTQVLASSVTGWLLVLSLVRFFGVRPGIAIAAGLAFALDPLQLLHERLVLPETFTLLVFGLFTLVGLQYLVGRNPWMLLFVCVLGLALVALRVVYVPVALSGAILLPVLARARNRTRSRPHLIGHLALAAAATLCLHSGYRWLIFELSGYSGTYQQNDGFYLASAWAPAIESQDTSDPRVVVVLDQLPVSGPQSRRELSNRDLERWLDGGLVDRLVKAFDGDSRAANLAARQLAYSAFRRDPIGIAKIATKTYLGFFGVEWDLAGQLLEDQGERRWFSPAGRALVRERFGLDPGPEYQHRRTAIKRYHLAAQPWYACLALAPLALLAGLALGHERHRRATIFVFSLTTVLLIATCLGASAPLVRYLHPFGFGCLLGLALVSASCPRVHLWCVFA